MGNRSTHDSNNYAVSLAPQLLQTNNTTVAGAAISVADFDDVEVVVNMATWGDTTTGGWELGLQHSADTVAGNFVDVPDAQMTNTVAGASSVTGAQSTGVFAIMDNIAEDDTIYSAGYLGILPFVRHFLTATGNQSTGTLLAIEFRRGRPRFARTGANESA